ncbi:threonine/serine exporter family protein [Clostridium botulinum]|uniref:Membrane protein n=1 Tax=Clostridium botulinum C/D str. DC5 TaxID=1443128 RepID=A0A0A0IFJ3_CLOBO|nr:threonine/serine exporter family protein [Clostridium botulinum]KEI03834.1 membrane protein [Clostridium botulinum C/D str. BKT75002]KEI09042.1 membrane protein [Clostridium botulinum C/D str. BKT2873]KGM93138.1 membrane protein [Clostridium botulinum D str. CCUG 7971]KGM99308.1 membrane protein [Clostridium botulinum C/D str. DC5]KOC50503.1 hypothetical protein ADU88_02225 [Clostridium botulinum]
MNNSDKILYLATEAGRIILQNGGETYRVEETMNKICYGLNVQKADSFVTPTGIMLSITDETGKTISLIRKITNRSINLEKVSEINALSRTIVTDSPSLNYVEKRLNEIDNSCGYNKKILILSASFSAGFFTLLFGGTFRDFFVSLFIGATIKFICIILNSIKINEFFINSLGGAIASLLAIISINLNIGKNEDKIIIGSIMLLVPGLVITNAIRDTLAGDLVSGISRTVEAFFIAIAIATGSGIIIKLWFYFGGL